MGRRIDRVRPSVVHGFSYRAKFPDGQVMYVTVNHDSDRRPFEIFVRLDDPMFFEWTVALTVLVTRALRADQPLTDIAKELTQIYGPTTAHAVPGENRVCPGIVCRLGEVLLRHAERFGG